MITALIYLVIYMVVVGLVVWLLLYLVDSIPLPPPFHQVARVAIMVIGVLILILLLLNFIGALDVGAPRLAR